MKMNVIIPVLCAIILGYLCASFIFNEYGIGSFTFSEKNNVYFLQCGAYNNKDTIDTHIDGIVDKITIKEGNKYYSYIGMTSNLDIAESIKKMYQEKGIDIYIKNINIENNEFLGQLYQYDVLLKSSKTIEEVNSVLKTILATYDEYVLNS